MSRGARVGSVLLTLVFPGFAQGLTFRRYRMLAFAVATVAATVAFAWSVWFVPVMLALRVAAAIDAYVVLRRHGPPGHRVLAAIAVVIGAVGYGGARVAVQGFRIPSSSMAPTLVIGDHIHVDKLSPRWRPPERGEVVVFIQPCTQEVFIKRVIAIGGDTIEVRCSTIFVNGKQIESELVAAHTRFRDRADGSERWFDVEVSRYRERHGGHTYDVFHDRERPAADQLGGAPDRHDFPRLDSPIAPSCRNHAFYDTGTDALPPTGTIVVTKPDASACEPQAHFVVPPGTVFVMGDNRTNANDSRYWGVVPADAVFGRAVGIWLSSHDGVRDWSRFGGID